MTAEVRAFPKQPTQIQKQTLVYRNGQWGWMPHKEFFNNMLEQHLKDFGNRPKRRMEETAIRAMLSAGQVVHVNGSSFRLKHQTPEKKAA